MFENRGVKLEIFKVSKVILPKSVEQVIRCHTGRKLSWLNLEHHGHAVRLLLVYP